MISARAVEKDQEDDVPVCSYLQVTENTTESLVAADSIIDGIIGKVAHRAYL